MAVGENALDPQVIGTDQILKEFGGEWRGDIVQQIAGVHGYLPSGGVNGTCSIGGSFTLAGEERQPEPVISVPERERSL
ncbi:hypothetical protein VAWG005_38820 [Aeromonas dhakensis]|nr:hypothetical protein VAWG003_38800 [Aeromonas dhakensis]BEE27954.1 hypothetical protein VAWG005_38820 [Aeromonas dhakensis]